MHKKYTIIFLSAVLSFIYCSNINFEMLSNEAYVTSDDGTIRMNLNIMGHVKNPGTYLVYDGIDIMTAVALAGGYLHGANLKNVIVYHMDGSKNIYNLKKTLNTKESVSKIKFKPNDTIYINETTYSKIINSSKLPSLLLSLLNIAITLERTN